MATAADEWRDAFRRARNAAIAWTAVLAATAVVATRQTDDDHMAIAATVAAAAGVAVLYGLWRLWRLLVVRRDLSQATQRVGRVYVALVTNPLLRNVHEIVAVWTHDWRGEGGRSRRPDRIYMADLSEDEHTDSFYGPVVREAWTPMRPDGSLGNGRWFRTADNVVLTVRRGGPYVWLSTVRGFPNAEGVVMAPDFDPSEFTGLDRPVGFDGLARAVLLRVGAGAALALLIFWQID